MKPWNNHPRRPAGSCGKSNTSIRWKPGCGNNGPAPACAKPFAPMPKQAHRRTHRTRPDPAQEQRQIFAQSLLGSAIDYALGQWQTLDVYLDDGRVEIDNNLVENAIRPTALGKKNWLFMGEADAGERGSHYLHHHRKLPSSRH